MVRIFRTRTMELLRTIADVLYIRVFRVSHMGELKTTDELIIQDLD